VTAAKCRYCNEWLGDPSRGEQGKEKPVQKKRSTIWHFVVLVLVIVGYGEFQESRDKKRRAQQIRTFNEGLADEVMQHCPQMTRSVAIELASGMRKGGVWFGSLQDVDFCRADMGSPPTAEEIKACRAGPPAGYPPLALVRPFIRSMSQAICSGEWERMR
jgi:hypothetical protein